MHYLLDKYTNIETRPNCGAVAYPSYAKCPPQRHALACALFGTTNH